MEPEFKSQFLTIAEVGRWLKISRQAAWKAARRGNYGRIHLWEGRMFIMRSELIARYGSDTINKKAG